MPATGTAWYKTAIVDVVSAHQLGVQLALSPTLITVTGKPTGTRSSLDKCFCGICLEFSIKVQLLSIPDIQDAKSCVAPGELPFRSDMARLFQDLI